MAERRRRCPKGTRKNKEGECVVKSAVGESRRCGKGTRKNKKGCVEYRLYGVVEDVYGNDFNFINSENISYIKVKEMRDEIVKEESKIKVPNRTVKYVTELMNRRMVSEMRLRDISGNLGEERSDGVFVNFIAELIMRMGINETRDSHKIVVTEKIIRKVIENDDELRSVIM
jgi:hypothetical protein